MADFPGIITRVKVDTSGAKRDLGEFTRTVDGVRGALSAVTRQAAGFGLAMLGLRGLDQTFHTLQKAIVGVNAQLETSELQFEILLGNARKAKEHVKSLFDFAAKTPFEAQPIIEASRTLLTFGIRAEQSGVALKRVGDVAAIANQPIQEVAFWYGRLINALENKTPWVDSITALTRMAAVGGDLRGRLEAMEKSGRSAGEMITAVNTDVDRLSGGMQKLAGTWTGLMSTITDSINLALAKGFKPLFDELKALATSVAQFVQTDEFGAWATATSYQLIGLIGLLKELGVQFSRTTHREGLTSARDELQRRLTGLENQRAISIFGRGDYDDKIAAAKHALAQMDAQIAGLPTGPPVNPAGGAFGSYGPFNERGREPLPAIETVGMKADEVQKAMRALIDKWIEASPHVDTFEKEVRQLVESLDLADDATRNAARGIAEQIVTATEAAAESIRATKAELELYNDERKLEAELAEAAWQVFERTANLRTNDVIDIEASKTALARYNDERTLEQQIAEAGWADFERQQDERRRVRDILEREREELRLLNVETREGKLVTDDARAGLELYGKAFRDLTDEQKKNAQQLSVVRRETRELQAATEFMQDIFGSVGRAFETLAQGIILGTRDLKSAFRDLGTSIVVEFAQTVIRKALNPLMDALAKAAGAAINGAFPGFFSASGGISAAGIGALAGVAGVGLSAAGAGRTSEAGRLAGGLGGAVNAYRGLSTLGRPNVSLGAGAGGYANLIGGALSLYGAYRGDQTGAHLSRAGNVVSSLSTLQALGGSSAAGALGTVVNVGFAVYDLSQGQNQGAAIGTLAGTVIGGVVGSIVPVVGTWAGAAIGGALGGLIGGFFGKEDVPHAVREAKERARDLGTAGSYANQLTGMTSLGSLYEFLASIGSGTTGGTSPLAVVTALDGRMLGDPNPYYPVIGREEFKQAALGGSLGGGRFTSSIQSGILDSMKAGPNSAFTQTVVDMAEILADLERAFMKDMQRIETHIMPFLQKSERGIFSEAIAKAREAFDTAGGEAAQKILTEFEEAHTAIFERITAQVESMAQVLGQAMGAAFQGGNVAHGIALFGETLRQQVLASIQQGIIQAVTTSDAFMNILTPAIQPIQELLARVVAASPEELTADFFGERRTEVQGIMAGVSARLQPLLPILSELFAFNQSLGGIGLTGSLAPMFQVPHVPTMPGFAHGGSFRVGGFGGTDSQLVAFRATPGEEVDVRTGRGGRSMNVTIVIHGGDKDARAIAREVRDELLRLEDRRYAVGGRQRG